MKTIPVIILYACLLSACSTPSSTQSKKQTDQTPAAIENSSNSAVIEPEKTTAGIFSKLREALASSGDIESQYLPDDSIALRLSGDRVFAFGSAKISPEQAIPLQKISTILQLYPQSHMEIVGYTDDIGPKQYNMSLSAKRAESVAQILTRQGMLASSIETRGAGEANPIANNGTAEGRSQNRRVEIAIMAE